MLKDRKAHESRLEIQLARWKADVDKLIARPHAPGAFGEGTRAQTRAALHAKHLEASLHLDDLKRASDEAWLSLKAGADATWTELEAMLGKASQKP